MMRHNQTNLTVVKHNHLNQASYKLSLDERRLILSAIALVNPREKMPEEITIHASDYGHQWGMDERNAYEQIKQAKEALYDRSMRIRTIDDKGVEVRDVRWVDEVAYKDGEGYVKLSFTKKIRPYLSELKSHFTSYHLTEVKSFKSGHAIRLYELLMQYKKNGWYAESVENLKAIFGVEDSYPLWYEFQRRVIKPSVKEINQETNYTVKYETKRSGRKISHVLFNYILKKQSDMFK